MMLAQKNVALCEFIVSLSSTSNSFITYFRSSVMTMNIHTMMSEHNVLSTIIQSLDRMFGAEMSQETQDQFRGNSQFSLAIRESVMDSFDHRANRDTARSMRLWIEKDLSMPDVLFFGLSEISPREVEEITIMKKHAAPLVIDVEEGLQIGKCIGAPDLVRSV